MDSQNVEKADYQEVRLIRKSEKSTVHLVQKDGEDQVYIRKILRGGGKRCLSCFDGMPPSVSAKAL